MPADGSFPKLKEDQAVGEIDDNFICMMCTEIVTQPQACTDCSRLFCHDCMESWKQMNAECPCPNCQKPFRNMALPEFLQRSLYKIDFKCDVVSCKEKFTYT